MTPPDQCRFMAAAYPDLNGDDTCRGFHRHDETTFALARQLAGAFQQPEPTNEQVAWFLNDAQAIIDVLVDGDADSWHVGTSTLPIPRGCDYAITVNGVEFLIPESEWEPSLPELRRTWLRDRDMTEHDVEEDAS